MHIAFQCNAPCDADPAWLSGYLYPLLLFPHTTTISLPTLSSAMSTMLSSLRYLAGTEGPSGFGSRTTAEEATSAAGDLSHITAIITGATSGIGAETARALAKRGARLVLPARNLKAAEEARARLLAELGSDAGTGRVVVLPLDLSSLASVRRFANRFLALRLPLNLLMYVTTPSSSPRRAPAAITVRS